MASFLSLADFRDVFVIIYGFVGIVFFVVASAVTLMLAMTIKGLVKELQGVMDDSVKPTLNSVKEAAETVKGTTEFVGRTAIGPIVRTYGIFAGLKRATSVLGAVGGKRRR